MVINFLIVKLLLTDKKHMNSSYNQPYDPDAPTETKDLQHYQFTESTEGTASILGGVILGVVVPVLFWVFSKIGLIAPLIKKSDPTASGTPTDSMGLASAMADISNFLEMLPLIAGIGCSVWLLGFIMMLVPVIKNRGGAKHTWGLILYCCGPAVFVISPMFIMAS